MSTVPTPAAWAVTACSKMYMGEFAELDAKAEVLRIGGECIAYALYTAPVVAPDVKDVLINAINFAIQQGFEGSEFLNEWLRGDTSLWPEFVRKSDTMTGDAM